MAVILEAYLLGCGQDMLDSFSQQVQAVEALQKIAVTIKQTIPEWADLPPAGATPMPLIYFTMMLMMNVNCQCVSG